MLPRTKEMHEKKVRQKKVCQKKVDVLDYGGGNLGSMLRCLERLDQPYRLVDAATVPCGESPLIVPGQGAFGPVMHILKTSGLDQYILQHIKDGVPYLGICIGLQILFDTSEEAPNVAGLGVLKGRIEKFKHGKIPQMGWNPLKAHNPQDPQVPKGFAYFVNSYVAVPEDSDVILYTADYFGDFCASVKTGAITAHQFHPEKSGRFGQQLIQQWLSEVL